jgi:hypothetical protein
MLCDTCKFCKEIRRTDDWAFVWCREATREPHYYTDWGDFRATDPRLLLDFPIFVREIDCKKYEFKFEENAVLDLEEVTK